MYRNININYKVLIVTLILLKSLNRLIHYSSKPLNVNYHQILQLHCQRTFCLALKNLCCPTMKMSKILNIKFFGYKILFYFNGK